MNQEIRTFPNVRYPKSYIFYRPYDALDDLKKEDLVLLSKNEALQFLLGTKQINLKSINKTLETIYYDNELNRIHIELVKFQQWVIKNNQRIILIYEGRDAAGKGGAIRDFTERLNARHFSVNALPKPTPTEIKQWYFQRYVERFPRPGDIVFFNRSWYNRAVVEPVNNFCTHKQYEQFMQDVNDFENMLIADGIHLIKIYFSINYEQQGKRLNEILNSPLKQWKFSKVDAKAQELWSEYTKYKEKMFEKTSTEYSPWAIIDANSKKIARLTSINYILSQFNYH